MSSAIEFKDIGNKHLQAKEFDQAIEAYTKAIELDGSNHVFYSNRSAAYLSKGDATNALADGLKCTEVNPSFAKGYSRHAAALHALKRYDEAVEVYNKGLAIAPNDAGLKSGLEEVKKASMPPPAGGGLGNLFSSPQFMAKLAGHPKYAAKMLDPAFKAKLSMMQTNPQAMLQDPEMMEVLQIALGGLEGMGGASGAAPSRAGGDDDDVEDIPVAGKNFVPPVEKKPKVEVDEFAGLSEEEKAVKENKVKADAHKQRGNALYKAKKLDEAIAAYDEAIASDPSNILYINNKAAVFIEKGLLDEAIALCEEALAKGKELKSPYEDKAKVHSRIGAAYVKKGEHMAAIKAYESAQMEFYDKNIASKIKNLELEAKKAAKLAYIKPELALEAKERGNDLFRAGDFPGAIKEYEEATKRDPSNASYYNNLAAALVKMADFNGARAAVEKSLEKDPKYVKAWAKKGDIEFFMKEYHKAIDSYRNGLQIEPGNSLCQKGLEKTQYQIAALNQSGEQDPERAAHAMADPEIQMILSDPVIRQVLTDFQENPAVAQRAMNDVNVRSKIEKLIAAGVLKVG